MGTETKFTDEPLFERSMQDVRDDATDTNLLIVAHVDNNPQEIDVIHTVSDVSQLGELLDDTQVMYVLARLEVTIGTSTTVKFVYIHWVGTKVPFSKRGRFGIVQGNVRKYLQPFHADLEANSPADVTKEILLQKVQEKSGAK